MRIVRDQIEIAELAELAADQFGELVKAVVDIDREIMAVGGGMHADEEKELLLVDDPAIRARVAAVVDRLVKR